MVDISVNIAAAFIDLVELEFEVLVDLFVPVQELVQPVNGPFLVVTVTIHIITTISSF